MTSHGMVPASTADQAQPIVEASRIAEALVEHLTDHVFDEWTFNFYGIGDVACLYEEEWSKEDFAAPSGVMILRGPDGRIYHGTVTVTLTEQTVRTPVEDDDATPAGAA